MGVERFGTQLRPETKASLEHIARDLAALTRASLVTLWSADDTARTLSVAASLGEGGVSLPLVTLPYGVGGVGWIAVNHTPLEIPDVFGDPRFVGHDWRRSHGLASFSGVPLMADDRLLGVLALDAPAPIELTAAQRNGVAGLVARASSVLDEARRDVRDDLEAAPRQLRTELQGRLDAPPGRGGHRHLHVRRQRDELEASRAELEARVREMATLVSVAGILGATSDLTGALRLICRELGRLTGADTVAAYVVDRQRGEVSPVAGYHVPEAVREGLRGARLALGDAHFSDALLEEGHVVWSDDAPHDARFANSFFARFPHRSCAFIPLVAGIRMSGVLHLVWWTQPRRFAAGEVALLQAIGQQAAILLENARLLEAEVRAQELRAVTRLANAAAHEINNPLAVIVGHMQILASRADGAERGRFERMLAAAARIGEIVEHMTQITRLENLDTAPNLPPMLDLRRSSEKDPPTGDLT